MTSTASVDAGSRRLRRILTPEGVELTVELADRGSRAAAFLIDVLFAGLGAVAIVLLAFALTLAVRGWGVAIGLLAFFLLRNFYFAFFELRWRGTTPGKRLIGLRVIDRLGGPLRPEAIAARNLMREIEVFMPLSLLLLPQVTGASAEIKALLLIWAGIFLLMPFFNRDALRLGDMVGGTMVITVPKAAFLPDLVAGPASARAPGPGAVKAAYRFTDAQLEIYGIYELQTLESVLRQNKEGDAIRAQIAERIRRKIGWTNEAQAFEADGFLQAFYAAQRARLERKMLFGIRRKDKHDRG